MNKRALAWGRLAAHDLEAVRRMSAGSLRSDSETESAMMGLDEIVSERSEFLTAYQDARLARRYAALIEQIAEHERKLCDGETALAEVAARSYFKLLSYKDEYEVARLYTDGSFRRQLEREFTGDYKLRIHLAPQVFNRRDPRTGRARKLELGSWFFPVLKVLSSLRFLRGRFFDPFGWTAHRRRERGLIREFETTIAELLERLRPGNHALAVEIARIPQMIRGFDSVKEETLVAARAKQEELLASFRLHGGAG